MAKKMSESVVTDLNPTEADTALATIDNPADALALLSSERDTALAQVAQMSKSTVDFFPRLELTTGLSEVVKAKLAIPGVWIVNHGNDKVVDLGGAVAALICTARPKALSYGGEPKVVNYDADSPIFEAIRQQSLEGNYTYRFGVEYLLWLPDVGHFATYHLNNKSARRLTEALTERLGTAVTLVIGQAPGKDSKGNRVTFDAPKVVSYEGRLEDFGMPSVPELTAAVLKYKALESTAVELA